MGELSGPAHRRQPLPLDGKKILVIAYGHLADTMAAIPGLRTLRAAYPHAVIHVLGLEAASPIFRPCPYIDDFVTFRDLRHKGSRIAKLEKLQLIGALALRLRQDHYDATLLFHRSAGTMRKVATLIGSPVIAGISGGGDGYTHPVRFPSSVESSREENGRVLAAIGVEDKGGPMEVWSSAEDAEWADGELAGRRRPLVGLHPGSDWSCQQWLPDRFAAVAHGIQAQTGATVVITGSNGERDLEAEVVDGIRGDRVQLCGRTTFGQLVEVVRRLDVLICVNSAAAAVARAVHTPAVVLLGLEDARYTGLTSTGPQAVIQPEGLPHSGSWCEFGRWGVLSGCQSPMCRGLGGLSLVAPERVTEAAVKILQKSEIRQR